MMTLAVSRDALAQAADGRIWIHSPAGMVVYAPSELQGNRAHGYTVPLLACVPNPDGSGGPWGWVQLVFHGDHWDQTQIVGYGGGG